MKKVFLIFLCSVVIFAVFAGIFLGAHDYHGLRKISARQKIDGTVLVTFKCFDFSGYSVTSVDATEKAYMGEKLLPINDDLGDFVIKILLCDTDVSKNFMHAYASWNTYQIDGTDLRFMYSYVDDHGVVVYIGSDQKITPEQISVKPF